MAEINWNGKTYQLDPKTGRPPEPVAQEMNWGTRMRCMVCDADFRFPGGFAGTDLCGPCATGESETIDDGSW